MMVVPSYLKGYEDIFAKNPREAGLTWFRQAKYGLFLHYGLYSLLGRHEWVQYRECIPVAEYEKLAGRFTAEGFDAEHIADFAVECGMRYVNLTTRHHDGFCLFQTGQTPFQSMNSPAKRDLVKELASACEEQGLGLCLYYSHGRDWRHPHAPNNDEWGGSARPNYDPPEPSYVYGREHDLGKYLEFMNQQIRELLTNYGPIAAIWLDGIAVPMSGDSSRFYCQETYDLIHSLQSQVLVSYKQGITGTEDFFAPEEKVPSEKEGKKKMGKVGQNKEKTIEICTTMAPGSWGYTKETEGNHKTPDDVWQTLCNARAASCNLLLNTGPLPDGSLDPEDERTLREVGGRIREEGFPSEPDFCK